MAIKKIGIVCDNYKVAEFKKNLIDNGYPEIKETPFKDKPLSMTLLTLEVDEKEVPKLSSLLTQLEVFFKTRKFN